MWVQIPPLFKIYCTYLSNYYLILFVSLCSHWYQWNHLTSKLKTNMCEFLWRVWLLLEFIFKQSLTNLFIDISYNILSYLSRLWASTSIILSALNLNMADLIILEYSSCKYYNKSWLVNLVNDDIFSNCFMISLVFLFQQIAGKLLLAAIGQR